MPATSKAWNALIRTHHITSRKKVAKLKQAASAQDVLVLLRSGSSPGIMYVEGTGEGVEGWVSVVQKLRYKNYQLASRPAEVVRETNDNNGLEDLTGLHETESVKDFAQQMQDRGVFAWWRKVNTAEQKNDIAGEGFDPSTSGLHVGLIPYEPGAYD
ncbi:hypothetical protein B0A50_03605 [Salinomyces thailandicus]|uniref:Uncharacterized protein n=1 Tax=Salinomyces thailandicus TaxID=706561 RepID=A0A4U0U4W7_9PEZI|nr:hypothetical protein B0A50_03605 [Salinomyces thailandica]